MRGLWIEATGGRLDHIDPPTTEGTTIYLTVMGATEGGRDRSTNGPPRGPPSLDRDGGDRGGSINQRPTKGTTIDLAVEGGDLGGRSTMAY